MLANPELGNVSGNSLEAKRAGRPAAFDFSRTVPMPATVVLPEGITNPVQDLPEIVFLALLKRYLACERIDMTEIALSLNVGRVTLFRYAGNREAALGALVWYLMQKAIAHAMRDARGLRGLDRVRAAASSFMKYVHVQVPFRHWLDNEPDLALRILTSKQGPVQASVVEATRLLLDAEVRGGHLRLNLDSQTLAYAVVRLGEGFLYSDVIVGHPVDLDLAVEVIARLVGGSTLTATTLLKEFEK